jgi:hypothetical protein
MGRTLRGVALAGVVVGALATASPALADGDETLGTPTIPIASGTDALVAGIGTQPFADEPVSFEVTVPAGATVKQVIAYWQGQYTPGLEPEGPDDAISVNGNAVTGSAIAEPVNPYFDELFETFRADITSLDLVDAGANTLTVADMHFATEIYQPSGNKGFGVLVIYDDRSGSTLVGVKDGQDYAYAGFAEPLDTTEPQTFSFSRSSRDRAASLGLLVGDTLDSDETPTVGNVITGRFDTGEAFSVVNQLQSSRGPDFDAENLPVTVPAGARSLTVQILSEGGDRPASLAWIASSLTVDTDTPPEEPEPCKPHWASKYKWLVWLKWWTKWLSHEYGDRHAAKYASYWGGADDGCKPGHDGCKNRKIGFWFGKHRSDCKPRYRRDGWNWLWRTRR